ncbi:MAG: hypothetical protein ACUVQG_14565 [Thermogutta sp.]
MVRILPALNCGLRLCRSCARKSPGEFALFLNREKAVGGNSQLTSRGLFLIFLAVSWVWLCQLVEADELLDAVQRQTASYRQKLEELAQWCESKDLTAEAERTRRWLHPVVDDRLLIPIWPAQIGFDTPPDGASPDQVEWYRRWTQLRKEQADRLFTLARGAVRKGRAGLALDLAMAALHENPDHEAIRRLFGYEKYAGFWRTSYEVRRLRAGEIWHPEFGWIPKAHVARYEKGERFFNGRWISAEEEAALRSNLQNGWVLESAHYRVLTNHSREEGVKLLSKLEQLNELWSRLFIRFYASEAQVMSLFDARSRPTPLPPKQHKVILFRNRDEYIQALVAAVPQIGITSGMYDSRTQSCYFFAGAEADTTTIYHEATHQLFQEVGKVTSMPGARGNFWIVEAAAMYMETLRTEEDFLVLGGIDTPRLLAARVRFLQDRFYVPLGEFVSLGIKEWQNDPRIGALYSQAAGLMQFLMHYDGGRYRDATVNYLAAVYAGIDAPETLSRLTNKSYRQLDDEYAAYLKSLPPLPPMRILNP